jgi:hypothetical protein
LKDLDLYFLNSYGCILSSNTFKNILSIILW